MAAFVSVAFFVAAAPFAQVPLAPVPAFIPAYQAAFVVCDLVTAMLLFGQLQFFRSRALLVLACGYLFTSSMAVVHALTFPGLFATRGLLGAGPQSTAWLYMLWHAIFPLAVMAYARLAGPFNGRHTPALAVGATLAVALASGLLATVGHAMLPEIMAGNRYTPLMIAVVGSVWALSAVALVMLRKRRPRTVLDAWLMVVMCAWIFDIALAAVLNAGRFDVGFYAGRIYGLLAACFVLAVLLRENGRLYRKLRQSNERLASELQVRRLNAALERRVAERTAELEAANRELQAFDYSISHDLRAPIQRIRGFSDAVIESYGQRLDDQGRRFLDSIARNALRMDEMVGDLLRLSTATGSELERMDLSITAVAERIAATLRQNDPGRPAEFVIQQEMRAHADRGMMEALLENLLDNAWKFTSRTAIARIEVFQTEERGATVFHVRDNGAGFDSHLAERLFRPFSRLHDAAQFKGTGIGLATARRIVHRHGGRIWGEGARGEGATFSFTVSPQRVDVADALQGTA